MADTAPVQWAQLLRDAIEKPGTIHEAYSRFWQYSPANQMLALWECHTRGIQPGPLASFMRWKQLGRYVRKGEKAITLCMPLTVKRRESDQADDDPQTFTRFVYRPHWFVVAQTEGQAYEPPALPGWEKQKALAALQIEEAAFDELNGNAQGFATGRKVAVSPIAALPHKTLFHEMAHVVLGHTAEGALTDDDRTPADLREVEAEAVALVCCESLDLDGAAFCRGYIQNWIGANPIPERSAQKIFHAADSILKAGRE